MLREVVKMSATYLVTVSSSLNGLWNYSSNILLLRHYHRNQVVTRNVVGQGWPCTEVSFDDRLSNTQSLSVASKNLGIRCDGSTRIQRRLTKLQSRSTCIWDSSCRAHAWQIGEVELFHLCLLVFVRSLPCVTSQMKVWMRWSALQFHVSFQYLLIASWSLQK